MRPGKEVYGGRDDVWQDAFGSNSTDTRGLNRWLEERIAHFMERGS